MDFNDNSKIIKAVLLICVFLVFSVGAMAAPLAGSNANVDKVLYFDTTSATYSDITTNASDTNLDDIMFPNLTNSTGDYLYLGMNYHFTQINFSVSTAGANSSQPIIAVVWQYSNGTASTDWKSLSADTDSCGNFTTAGNCTVDWVTPVDMATQSVNGSTYYWVRATGMDNYSTIPLLSQISVLEFNLEVNVTDELNISIINLVEANFSTNSSFGILDFRELGVGSGVYQFALMQGEKHQINVTIPGYINASNTTPVTLNSTLYQWPNSHTMLFGLKVIAANELGAGGTIDAYSFRGVTASAINSNVLYWNDTSGANGVLFMRRDGMVDVNVTNTGFNSITTNHTAQLVITMGSFDAVANSITASVNAKGFEFAHKINVTTELGSQIAGASVYIGAFPCFEDGSFYYCPVNASLDAVASDINVTLDGYVEKLQTSGDRADNTSVQIIDNVTSVLYSLKVNATTELGGVLTGATVTAGSTNLACAENGTSGLYYCAVLVANDGGTNDVNISKLGFLVTHGNSLNRVFHNDSQSLVNITNVSYTVKVTNMTNELGTDLGALDGTTNIITPSVGGVTYNGGKAYINATGTTVNIIGSRAGLVNKTVSSIPVSNMTQNVTNVTNLFYTIRVANMTNELGTDLGALDGTTNIIVTDSGTVLYNVGMAYINATAATTNLTGSRSGLVNKTSSVTVSTSAQNVTNVTGLLYTLKIANISTELNNQAGTIGTEANVTSDSGTAVYSSNIIYINATAAVTNITAWRLGFVNKTVGYAVSNGAQNVTNVTGLLYTVKVENVTDELNNYHVTINGAEVIIASTSGTVVYSGNKAYINATAGATLTASKSG
ncbi:MAG: hypothetical protein V1870_05650, partial [Candidatus Aenigmatarchaeota archaeon]